MGTIPTYDIGDKVRIGNHLGSNDDGNTRDAFTNVSGVATDPSAVTLRVRKRPSGTTHIYSWPSAGADGTLTKEATGRFYFDVSFTTGDDGRWAWRIEGTGTVTAADEGEFTIVPSAFF